MASFELQAFQPTAQLQIIAAVDMPDSGILQLGFWLNDPLQQVILPTPVADLPRQDFLWQHTCFEAFIGLRPHDEYREVHFSPSLAWQAYAFEEYRYPETMPPQLADDIHLLDLRQTKFGLTASINIQKFLQQYQCTMRDIFIGICAVLDTAQGQHFFALQHSSPQADFHNKRDWIYCP